MADRRLAIEITVEGDAERKFKDIGRAVSSAAKEIEAGSQKGATAIDKVGKSAASTEDQVKELEVAQKRAAKAADEMTASSGKSSSAVDKLGISYKQAGAGLALLGAGFTRWSQDARTHELTLIALQRVYGEATDSYIQFADHIQNTSIFSNDQALEAARIMSTLKLNYELTDAQIQQLIQTSADLATVSNVSLVDAATRVQSAIRGEAESAEWLSLTMNQAAIDTEGVTLSMSNAEAAGYRYTQMMGQSSFATGAAAEAAATTTGHVQKLANEFQDARLQLVEFTGPVGDVAAGLASFGADTGLAVAGLGMLAPAAKSAAIAVKGLSAATLGPVGIAVGLGAVTVAAWKYFDSLGDNGITGRMNEAASAGDDLAASIARVSHEMATASLGLNLFGDLDTLTGQAYNDVERLEVLSDRWEEVAKSIAETGKMPQFVTVPGDYTFEQAKAEWDELIALYLKYGSGAAETLTEVSNAYNEIITNTLPGHEAALQTAMNIFDDFQAGKITLEQLRDQLNGVIADLPNYARQQLEAAAATEQNTKAAIDAARAIKLLRMEQQLWNGADYLTTTTAPPIDTSGLWSGVDDFVAGVGLVEESVRRLMARQNREGLFNSEDIANYADEVLRTNKAYSDLFPTIDQTTRASLTLDSSWTQLTGTAKSELGPQSELLAKQFEEAMQNALGLSDALSAIRARGGSATVDLAVNTSGAQSALQSGYNAIVGGTNAMGQLAEQTWNWSHSLTEGNLGQSKLDQLLLDGVISQKTYGQALDANHRIMLANESVQEDVLRIQAKQLPVMAQLAEEHARYVDRLADEDVATQTVALGYMDQAKAAQAMQLANLASTAAMAGMTSAAESTITSMAEADPVLKAMLVDMGLIKEGATGEIEVTFPNSSSLTTAVDNLSSSVDALTDALLNIPPDIVTQVTLEDHASTYISAIDRAMQDLDGKTATVTINSIAGPAIVGLTPEGYSTGGYVSAERRGPAESLIREIAMNGVPSYGRGGQVSIVGEHGPELVNLPADSTVTNAAGTRGRLNPRGRGRRNPIGDTIINKGTVHMAVYYDDSADRAFSRKIAGRRR